MFYFIIIYHDLLSHYHLLSWYFTWSSRHYYLYIICFYDFFLIIFCYYDLYLIIILLLWFIWSPFIIMIFYLMIILVLIVPSYFPILIFSSIYIMVFIVSFFVLSNFYHFILSYHSIHYIIHYIVYANVCVSMCM